MSYEKTVCEYVDKNEKYKYLKYTEEDIVEYYFPFGHFRIFTDLNDTHNYGKIFVKTEGNITTKELEVLVKVLNMSIKLHIGKEMLYKGEE